ncbi:MAG: hypothetical protein Q4A82_02810 [Corynebacterium sp.]|nr:hypothetical protein [Corynebacterium sp.]
MSDEIGTMMQPPVAAHRFVKLHPDVPRPNFLWYIHLPLNLWKFIDIHPERWQAQNARLVEDFIPGVRLRAAEKRGLRNQLEKIVFDAQEAGVLMTLVLPGILESGIPFAASLRVRWYNMSPARASIEPLKSEFRRDDVDTYLSDDNVEYLLVKAESTVGPLTKQQTAYHVEAYLPIIGTSWLLIISSTVPTKDMVNDMCNLVTRVVNSVQTYPSEVNLPVTQLCDSFHVGDTYFTYDSGNFTDSSD